MLESIRHLIAFLDPKSRLHFALLLLPMLAMTALEIVSISLILPVIQILLLGQTEGPLTEIVLALIPASSNAIDQGVWVTSIFAGFFVAKNILLLWMIYIVNRIVSYETAEYTHRLFRAYMSRPLTFHFSNNSADLLRNITTGVGQSLEAVRLVLLMILDAMLMLGAIFLLVAIEPQATLGTAAILGVVGLIFYKLAGPVFQRWGKRTMALDGDLIKWINQSFNGIREVKLLHADDYLAAKVYHNAIARAGYLCRLTTSIQIPRLLIETVVVVGFLGVVWALLSTGQAPGEVISTLGLFGMAALRLMPSMNRFLTGATAVRQRTAYITTVHNDMMAAEKPTDPHPNKGEDLLPFADEINIEDVGYAYPDAEHHALHGISLTIPKGRSVGFVGSTGAGKSTLMDIILGLLKPETGRLLIDGRNAGENLPGWHRHIGYVPQQVFLMDDTVRRNVAMGIDDENIDSDRMDDVVRLARLEEVVAGLPDGLDTMLGEHGTRLSGGQRQRIAIARALYRDPDVLVFDEATSALDNETEREISTAINTLSGDTTVLIVAHRLNTIRNCDMIVLLEAGKIIATGTYDELIKRSDQFRLLAAMGDDDGTESESFLK